MGDVGNRSENATGKAAFADLRVVDLGAGMSAALVAKQLGELGARVDRIKPPAGDPFYDVYPAYRFWHRHAVLNGSEKVADLLGRADICIVGGEDYPGFHPQFPSAEALSQAFPRLVVLQLVGDPVLRDSSHPAVDLLVQARLGIVHEQYSAKPNVQSFPMPSYGAALLGLIGTLTCLVERERSGRGQVVTASLLAGGAMYWGPFWMTAERPDQGFRSITPRDVRHLTLRCADAAFVQITMAVPGAVAGVYSALKIDGEVCEADRGMPDQSRGPAAFFGDVELYDRHARAFDRVTLVQSLRGNGVPVEAVLDPGKCWDDEQLRLNGLIQVDPEGWEYVGNPIRGDFVPASFGVQPARPIEPDPCGPPLAGFRVMDCGIFVAGPYTAKLLGDYGADVIRVEPPSGPATLSGERTIISANIGKRSIRIDAKTPDGRTVISRLCQRADIAMNNFRPGVSSRLGLDQQTLRGVNPHIITLETTAYGPEGPKASAPGFDMVIQAHCGLQVRAGGAGNPPLCTRTPIVDFTAGAVGAIAVLAALYEREKTGRVMAVETNLLNIGAWMMSELVRSPTGENCGAEVLNSAQTGFHPWECLYQTSDGWIAVAARSDAMAAEFAAALGVEAPLYRRDWGDVEQDRLADRIMTGTTQQQLRRLKAAGVWAEACVRDGWQEELRASGILQGLDDADYGQVQHCIGPLLRFSRSRTVAKRRLSGTVGVDSNEILRELGFSPEERTRMIENGTVI
ncbi:CoA transferase [Sphingobium sp. JS3065]|uniref:CoA transferase n=1 Tax=Sphingobium sp. JS3065 TaxID=2970925 RepID=UPI00226400B1|nr:CoA transferase [Sphingobium sp. JS3065]UZW57522.1 CoA transferase [Sphingobium sp. JS3065]